MPNEFRPPVRTGLSHGPRRDSDQETGLNGVQLWLIVMFVAVTLSALFVLWGMIDQL